MAIALRGTPTTATATGNGALSVNKPTGVVDGDVVLVFGACRGDGVITPPAGWTEVTNVTSAAATSGVRIYAWSRVAASEGASWSFSVDVGARLALAAVAYSGADTTTPTESAATNTGGATAGTTATAPTVTPTVAGGQLLTAYGNRTGGTNGFTTPTGMTEQVDVGTATNPVGLGVDDEARATTAATGTRASTIASSVWAALAFMLRPAPAGGGPTPVQDVWGAMPV